MSNRLVVNPGTSQIWEIELKPGLNRIGRGEQNDFTINHQSISTNHCEITVTAAAVVLKDLGSTNGSFVDRIPVTEIQLKPGQHIQFGAVDMIFESTTIPPQPGAPATHSAKVPPPPPASSGGLRLSRSRETTPPPPPPPLTA